MFAIMTEVDLKPGAGSDVAALFDATNPDLVRDQPDWLGAEMLLDEEADRVVVIARWRDPEAYRAMAETSAFKDTMQRFAAHFAGPPRVRVLKSAVTMTPESLRD
jgi:heme-degrading monooxygenase HmoA